MSEIDHEAAKVCAQNCIDATRGREDELTGSGMAGTVGLAVAYLDMVAQLATERARMARIRQALTDWAESPYYVFDPQGAETAEWLELNGAIYDNAREPTDA